MSPMSHWASLHCYTSKNLSSFLTLEPHNRATSTNMSYSPQNNCHLSVLRWQSTFEQVCSVDIIETQFMWKCCVLCVQVCTVGMWLVLGLRLFLVKRVLFFCADVRSRFHPAFKAVPKGRKMNQQCFATSFQRSHWEWAPLCTLG